MLRPNSIVWRTAGLCAVAGALAATLPAFTFFSSANLRPYTDWLLILLYFGLASALASACVGLPLAFLLRRRTSSLSWIPDALMAVELFAYPLTGILSEHYLLTRRLNPLSLGGSSWIRLLFWFGVAAVAALCFRLIRRWAARGIWAKAAVAILGIAALHSVYFALRGPTARDRSLHDPALDHYPHAVHAKPGSRILVLCLDGADWRIIDPLLNAGRLPHFAELIRSGARADLVGEPPYSSHGSWTSIFTGKRADKHGIKGRLMVSLPGVSWTRLRYQDRDNYAIMAAGSVLLELGLVEIPPIPSTFLRAKPVWKVLSDHGRTVWVLGIPATWPAYPVRGAMVTDRVSYSVWEVFYRHRDRLKGATYPESLREELDPLVVRPTSVTPEEIARFYEPTEKELRSVRRDRIGILRHDGIALFNRTYCMDRTMIGAFEYLADRDSLPDLAVLYCTGTDLAAHAFLQHRSPERFPAGLSSSEEIARFGRTIDRYWEYLDGELGRIVARYGEGDTVVFVSDHGTEPGRHHPAWNTSHGERGVFAIRGPGIRSGARLNPITLHEVAPILYHVAGFPVPDDGDGKLREELFSTPVTKQTIPSYD